MKVEDLEALEAYFDKEMSPEEAIEFEKRLEAEPELRQELESFKRCSALISHFPKIKVPFDLSKSVLERAATESPSPFALADSPVDLGFLSADSVLESTDGEPAQESVSKESENNYVDDWQQPTIMQRISRAMLWPTLVIIIAIGMYLSNPKDNSAPIQTKPDESEIADTSSNDNPKGLETSVPFLNPPADPNGSPMMEAVEEDPGVVLLPANDTVEEDVPVSVQASNEVQFQIACSVDAQKFNAQQWIAVLKELGVETDGSKAPLEVGSWTLSTTASQRAEILSVLNSVPGVVSVQSSAANQANWSADNSALTEIRLQPK
ncbi:MAG: hypothetical protein IJQ39_05425 [Thermoguttaceae bacterium]|nr:hypothetical protein [Thermoguttaceae bacterium]